jgi:hypothetical protein
MGPRGPINEAGQIVVSDCRGRASSPKAEAHRADSRAPEDRPRREPSASEVGDEIRASSPKAEAHRADSRAPEDRPRREPSASEASAGGGHRTHTPLAGPRILSRQISFAIGTSGYETANSDVFLTITLPPPNHEHPSVTPHPCQWPASERRGSLSSWRSGCAASGSAEFWIRRGNQPCLQCRCTAPRKSASSSCQGGAQDSGRDTAL